MQSVGQMEEVDGRFPDLPGAVKEEKGSEDSPEVAKQKGIQENSPLTHLFQALGRQDVPRDEGWEVLRDGWERCYGMDVALQKVEARFSENKVSKALSLTLCQGAEECRQRYYNQLSNLALTSALFLAGTVGQILAAPEVLSPSESDESYPYFLCYIIFCLLATIFLTYAVVATVTIMNNLGRFRHDAEFITWICDVDFDKLNSIHVTAPMLAGVSFTLAALGLASGALFGVYWLLFACVVPVALFILYPWLFSKFGDPFISKYTHFEDENGCTWHDLTIPLQILQEKAEVSKLMKTHAKYTPKSST
uniref:Uncharacterized protein n=1 Tax=Chromera velia CCMP2878 TaxID=1169474 RepID=A0A0G4HZH2_9ALVE|eukprot:Cvel_9734.t1-p1 / transcript=Cvel_9734.t1 / gene=Cvel_9734 / organism=Chromera_velia_CCMP2878 / gene_product=hypothetical protein / transcript_product=hypothetical protein / location=Cvel_scaffold569:15149-16066(+) / protein_length=306 / sequence_SO=supercontig / SO=protein_coding / is_pseudo=false